MKAQCTGFIVYVAACCGLFHTCICCIHAARLCSALHLHCCLVSLHAFLLSCITLTSNRNLGQLVMYTKKLFLKHMYEIRHFHSAAAACGCLEVQDCTCPVSQTWMYSTSAEARCFLQEALRTQKEPSTELNSRIWKMAGQVLMDNPDCPVEVSKAVHALMGISLPEVPAGLFCVKLCYR